MKVFYSQTLEVAYIEKYLREEKGLFCKLFLWLNQLEGLLKIGERCSHDISCPNKSVYIL
jgi:hypothetical protein